jgi:hypothetical protein
MFSFTARKKVADVQPLIRRIIDLTTPNCGRMEQGNRYENRHNRCVPVLLSPWRDDQPVISTSVLAITKDFSDRGVGIIVNEPVDALEVALGFYLEKDMSEPWYFLGSRHSLVPIGGNFWLLGIELTEFINESHQQALAALAPLAERLRPSCANIEANLANAQSLIDQAASLA